MQQLETLLMLLLMLLLMQMQLVGPWALRTPLMGKSLGARVAWRGIAPQRRPWTGPWGGRRGATSTAHTGGQEGERKAGGED